MSDRSWCRFSAEDMQLLSCRKYGDKISELLESIQRAVRAAAADGLFQVDVTAPTDMPVKAAMGVRRDLAYRGFSCEFFDEGVAIVRVSW